MNDNTSYLGYFFIVLSIFGIFITARNWDDVGAPEKGLAILGVIVGFTASAALLSGLIT